MTAADTVQVSTSGSLTLPLLAERIAHERDLRVVVSDYERQLRVKADEHETETRQLVERLEEDSRRRERERIEERLDVLNGERQRQEADRANFATRSEVGLTTAAIADKSEAAIRELASTVEKLGVTLTTEVRTLRESRERDLGRQSGSSGVTSFLAPNLPSVVAGVLGLIALYLALQRG